MISIIGTRALIKKFKNLACFIEAFLLDRWDFALPLPSAGLENSAYPREEVRPNKENNAYAFIENSDKAEKIWINRVLVSRRNVELPFFMSKNISLN